MPVRLKVFNDYSIKENVDNLYKIYELHSDQYFNLTENGRRFLHKYFQTIRDSDKTVVLDQLSARLAKQGALYENSSS